MPNIKMMKRALIPVPVIIPMAAASTSEGRKLTLKDWLLPPLVFLGIFLGAALLCLAVVAVLTRKQRRKTREESEENGLPLHDFGESATNVAPPPSPPPVYTRRWWKY